MSDELTVPAESLPVAHGGDVLTIIQRIVDAGLTIEAVSAVEKLLNMQERIMAETRRASYAAAMARLQAKLPQINKDGRVVVGGQERSRFARLEDLDTAIRPLLAEEGFSFSFNEESANERAITFTATLSHREGHSEVKRLTVPIDKAAVGQRGAVRTAIQDAGSTVSYARRYLIKMSLNIVERSEDTDGIAIECISQEQARDLVALADEVNADKKRFLEYMGVSAFEDILLRDLGKATNALETKRRQK